MCLVRYSLASSIALSEYSASAVAFPELPVFPDPPLFADPQAVISEAARIIATAFLNLFFFFSPLYRSSGIRVPDEHLHIYATDLCN